MTDSTNYRLVEQRKTIKTGLNHTIEAFKKLQATFQEYDADNKLPLWVKATIKGVGKGYETELARMDVETLPIEPYYSVDNVQLGINSIVFYLSTLSDHLQRGKIVGFEGEYAIVRHHNSECNQQKMRLTKLFGCENVARQYLLAKLLERVKQVENELKEKESV